MNAAELTEDFLQNPTKAEHYNRAIALLQEAGFEILLRRLGEPIEVPLTHPQILNVSAFEQAHRRGYYQAIDLVFAFFEIMQAAGEEKESADFGARQRMRDLGFKEEEIENIR